MSSMLTETTIQKFSIFFESTPVKDFPMHAPHNHKTLIKNLLAEELGKEQCFSSGFKSSTLITQTRNYFKVLENLILKVNEIIELKNTDHWPLPKDFILENEMDAYDFFPYVKALDVFYDYNIVEQLKVNIDISVAGVKRSVAQIDYAKAQLSAMIIKSMLKVRLTNNKLITAQRKKAAGALVKEKDSHRKEKLIRKTCGLSTDEDNDKENDSKNDSEDTSRKKIPKKRRIRKSDIAPALTENEFNDIDIAGSSELSNALKLLQKTDSLSAEVELVEASTKKIKADTELEDAKRKTIHAQLELM